MGVCHIRGSYGSSDLFRDARHFNFSVSTYIEDEDWDKLNTKQTKNLNEIKDKIETYGDFISDIMLDNLGLFKSCIDDKTKKCTINLATLGNINYLDEIFLSKELLSIQSKHTLEAELKTEVKPSKKLKV